MQHCWQQLVGTGPRSPESNDEYYNAEKMKADAMRGGRRRANTGPTIGTSVDQREGVELREKLRKLEQEQSWSAVGIYDWLKHIYAATTTPARHLLYELEELTSVRDTMLSGRPEVVGKLLQKMREEQSGACRAEARSTATDFSAAQRTDEPDEVYCAFKNAALDDYMRAKIEFVEHTPAAFVLESGWWEQERVRWAELKPESGDPVAHDAAVVQQSEVTARLIDLYCRASSHSAMIELGAETTRIKHLIATKQHIENNILWAILCYVFLQGMALYGEQGDEDLM